MSDAYVHSTALMGTVVTLQIVGHGADERERTERVQGIARAVEWFRRVEACCTRFDETSEIHRLTTHIGTAVPVSAIVYEAVRFALALAEESGGAFDPTIGHRMEARGFDREYRTGHVVRTRLDASSDASYRDVHLDPLERTITLRRPLVLDLGAVAKGLAVDMAARELEPFENFAIDAGGDLYLGGCNADGAPWSVGIRHPRNPGELLETLHVSNTAVCTSGDYERHAPADAVGHHIMDPRTGLTVTTVASVTVVAPVTMVADGLATAAFVLGPARGLELLERHGVNGLIVTPELERFSTHVA